MTPKTADQAGENSGEPHSCNPKLRKSGALPPEAFIPYSRKDTRHRKALEPWLEILRRDGTLNGWHDCQISAGRNWKLEIEARLESASLFLMLVSVDFLASEFIASVEMKRALERHEAGTARVVPIILRHAPWRDSPLAKLQVLPKDGRPIMAWTNRDEVLNSVFEDIRTVIAELRQEAPAVKVASR